MSAIRPWAQARLTDKTVSVIVGVGDLLMCGVLLLMSIGVLGAEPTTGAEETAAWHRAGELYVGWLLGGTILFAVSGMTRSLLAHVAMMLMSPVIVFVLMVVPTLR
ncbi:hypothetical protein QFZ75_001681 [Streptomyces sp. V3I8]|uniref:hypothetical protein n=1 Tax=Streptomyces sp. V3I8 TaxID=3042279 RepID=UPI0027840123|nr:hypothetical protein [Streptomyces sp. V3I8]MDQ1035265.1 hypothetical protein [Streptomyces sp. V3I8]